MTKGVSIRNISIYYHKLQTQKNLHRKKGDFSNVSVKRNSISGVIHRAQIGSFQRVKFLSQRELLV